MKVCSKCHIEKDEREFVKEKRVKSGYASTCLVCKNRLRDKAKEYLQNIQYRKNNSDKVKKWAKTCYQKNRDDRLARCKKRYIENRPEILEKQKKYAKKHKDRKRAYDKEYHIKNKLKHKERSRVYREKNKTTLSEKQKERNKKNPEQHRRINKKHQQELRDWYVRAQLIKHKKYTGDDIKVVPDLINIKKIQIINKRIKKQQNEKK